MQYLDIENASFYKIIEEDANAATTLFDAISLGRFDIVKELIDDGAAVDIKNQYGFTMLKMAIAKFSEPVRIHLSHNGSESAIEQYKKMMEEARAHKKSQDEEYLKIIKLLIDNGCTIDKNDFGVEGDGAVLLSIVSSGDLELTKWFLNQGFDANGKGLIGMTPLKKAVSNGDLEIVKLLVESGAINESVAYDEFNNTEADYDFAAVVGLFDNSHHITHDVE